MKRKIPIILIVLCVVLLAILACCSYKNWHEKRPIDQANTKWISEDQSIYIEVDQNEQATGYMIIDGERVEFIFTCAAATIDLYSPEAEDDFGINGDKRFEHWLGSFDRADRFTAKVEETTYFTVGQKIKFYRIDAEDQSFSPPGQ